MSNIFSMCPAEIRWSRSPEPTTRQKGPEQPSRPPFYGDKGMCLILLPRFQRLLSPSLSLRLSLPLCFPEAARRETPPRSTGR